MRPQQFLFFIVLVRLVRADHYIDEVQGRCYSTKKSFSCAKYQFLKSIDEYQLSNVSLTSDSSIKFISLPSANDTSEVHVFERSRQYFPQDTEIVKIFKFMKRRFVKFVQEQGVSFAIPEGAEIVTEEESRGHSVGKGKKGKKMIIFPILILLKLFKIKIITSLVLVGVIFIKKMLLTAAFILPGVVAAIKHHCKNEQQYHVVPYHVDEQHHTYDHEHEDAGYGFSSYGGDKHYWDKKKRFSYF